MWLIYQIYSKKKKRTRACLETSKLSSSSALWPGTLSQPNLPHKVVVVEEKGGKRSSGMFEIFSHHNIPRIKNLYILGGGYRIFPPNLLD